MNDTVCRFLAAFLLSTAAVFAVAGPKVETDLGPIEGAHDGGVNVFKGTPFAAPPIGELRWRAPQRAAAWQDVRPATALGKSCPQPPRPDRALRLEQSEDCLTLNVFAPQRGEKRPVMVWIHGGAFRLGSSAMRVYDGTPFAKDGVVLVTINYRLGRLGFFGHPALTKEAGDAPTGNFGILDQIAALEWVQRNIAQFGGDPANVTIFGESAGGSSVNVLMVSPLAKGLFAKAISQSGSGNSNYRRLSQAVGARSSVEADGAAFASSLKLAGADATTAELRGLSTEQAAGVHEPLAELGFGPFIDGRVITDDVGVSFAKGRQHRVPYLAGWNSFEASLMATFRAPAAQFIGALGDRAAAVRALYESSGPIDDTTFAQLLFTDAIFGAGARDLVAAQAAAGINAYLYHFTYVSARRRGQVPGAAHGSDVPYVFRAFEGTALPAAFFTAEDRTMGELMAGYWIRFATTGDPNGTDAPVWPAYRSPNGDTLELGPEAKSVGARKALNGTRLDIHTARYRASKGL